MRNIKSNRGATVTDVVTGVLILILFTGILTTSFYNIYKHNALIKYNSQAVDYVVKILEYTDRIKYEEVTNDLNNTIKEKFSIKNNFDVKIEVENYNKEDEQKEDIIKIVKVTVNYKAAGEKHNYSVQKLKIKER